MARTQKGTIRKQSILKRTISQRVRDRSKLFGVICVGLSMICLEIAIYQDLDFLIKGEKMGWKSQQSVEWLISGNHIKTDNYFESSWPDRSVEATTSMDASEKAEGDIADASTNGVTNANVDWPYIVRKDGIAYCGILQIDALQVELPIVYSEVWEEDLMEYGACIYSGDRTHHDLVLAAHDYKEAFLPLLEATHGMRVCLRLGASEEEWYEIVAIDYMHRSEREKLYEGEWDLTLFTCVPQTYQRIAVRCKLVSNQANK